MTISLVQSVAGSVINDYGLDNVPFTITNPAVGSSGSPQNMLVAFVTWNVAYFSYQSTGKAPAVNVTDSADNLWRQVGSTAPSPGSRSAIWVCINAQQVSWVSVALTGWGYSTSYVVSEFTGLPSTMQTVAVDWEQDNFSETAVTSLTVPNGIASGSDFVLGLAGVGTNASAFSTPAGWNKLATTAGGSAQYDAIVQPYWIASSSSSSLAFAPSWTTTGPASACMVGLSLTAPAPIQGRATFPRVIVEACFSAQPGDWTQEVDYTYSYAGLQWTDITTRVLGDDTQDRITVSRGRQYELSQEETGEMRVTLDNHDGAFDLLNPASPYYSNALNTNPSFQNTLTPWASVNNATLAQTNQYAYASGYGAIPVNSMKVNGNGSTAKPGAQSEKVTINPNFTYSVSTWMYSVAGYVTGAMVGVNWYTSGGSLISETTAATTALPAATWTQVINAGLTPPTNASFAQIVPTVLGTPGTASSVFMAESMLVNGTVFTTGQLTPGTPMRVTAWWTQPNGTPIQYPIGFGYVERWPQDWPDMPQWGFTEVIATDAYGPMTATNLPSAVGGDIRKDYPYLYFPTNEQYSFTSQSLDPVKSPIDANGLIAVNNAFGNNRFAAYRDGAGAAVEVGQALNLLGSEDTVLGTTGYNAQDMNDNGPGMFYFDPNIPANPNSTSSFSFEFWFLWGNGTSFQCTLLNVFAGPSTYYAQTTTPTVGGVISVGINTVSTGLYVNDFLIAGTEGTPPLFDENTFGPQHFAMTVGNNGVSIFLNGQLAATGTVGVGGTNIINNIPQIKAVVLGPGRFSYDNSGVVVYNSYNYSAGHLAWYNQELTPTMIANHYNAGYTGFVGVTAPYRFAQCLTWGLLGLKRGGLMWEGTHGTSQNTLMSEAYDLEGTSSGDAMNQLVATEGGRCYTQGNGSIVYIPRWGLYNTAAVCTFGDAIDGSEIPYLQESSFTVDNTYINNQINATQNRGPNQDIFYQQTNFPSQLDFFNRSSLAINSYAMSPFDVYGVVNWNMVKYNFPHLRIDHISVNPAAAQGSNPQTFAQVLALDLEQGALVNRRPIGAGTAGTYTVNGAIQRIEHNIGPNSWTTNLQITPRFPESNALVADASSDWSFSTSGTPAAFNYFIATTAQSLTISVGDQFTDTLNPGQKFTVTFLSNPFGGFVNVYFTPYANTVMTSDTVTQIPFNVLGNNYLSW